MLNTQISKAIKTTGKHLKLLEKLGIKTVEDFINYFPRDYTDASEVTKLAYLKINQLTTFKGTIINIESSRTKNGKFIIKAVFKDDTGMIEIIWFNQPYITRVLRKGSEIFISGKAKIAGGHMILSSPTFEIVKQEQIHTARIIPIYHETGGISSKWIREKLKPILESEIQNIEEYLPEEIIQKFGLISIKEAIYQIHFPKDESTIGKAVKRLGFDELLLIHLKSLIAKYKNQKASAGTSKSIKINYETIKSFLKTLPFELTKAQKLTLTEILKDMERPHPMARLLQGDVGSGKTIVAGIAAFAAIKQGYQTVFMAPTEILAKQHSKTFEKFFKPQGIKIELLIGSTSSKTKKEILEKLKKGEINLIIGTHALIQKEVKFKNLGLAIIDEQHRFGVLQREILNSHGFPHTLNLSATPIPRTLALTIYGDQDLSIIDEMPPGRKIIATHIVPENKRKDAYNWIRRQIKEKKTQVFIICPLIDESDKIEIKTVNEEYRYLANDIFPDLEVSFIHGKLSQDDKDRIMNDFQENRINILVSTSIIEVGIDVPNASIMIIEGSERFGLSQLHQFRGRIGRGEQQSYCFLFTNAKSEDGVKRLNAMTKFHSGFKLAEIDLSIRGPGEIFGVRQSGIPDLKVASLTDSVLISKVHETATILMSNDPELLKFPKLKEKLKKLSEIQN
ncbi:MAG: ATP-dependent DNA helicase RecG, ATP-dependent DNA helicase RecG [Candidatus Peregrinibacteria bacterium GW2011_GWF2_38_29]|nr:MAG: ATP-dependent DNA helicase RecG, ATP-dependent DNA helicase RecG [Candidatus Peregrinibacteria bacterium GW2011_GWF2_38_29]HBB02987.1 DNA helicase RecG [Candidatus Peregrinibacteria bacterium]